MNVRREVVPFLAATWVLVGVVLVLGLVFGVGPYRLSIPMVGFGLVMSGYFLYFFRDPERTMPAGDQNLVAPADGVVARIVRMREDQYLKADTVRISIFLSLFDVHVNRSPLAGQGTFLGYFPGKRLFTFHEKSSDVNQHNSILIEGSGTRCLLNQIVGPVCRRVVYWPDHNRPVALAGGERIGMMKFGSRLDLYFPDGDVTITAREGDRVSAGASVIGQVKGTR